MSYDVTIGDFECNHTWNCLSPICYQHLCKKTGIRSLDGKTGRQASEALAPFWQSVGREVLDLWVNNEAGEAAFCAKYDSDNGWGSTVSALVFMGQLTSACAAHPRHKVRVDT